MESEEEASPKSSTETLVDLVDVYPRAPLAAAKIEAIARQIEEKPKYALSILENTLIPLAIAQQRADVKYRPEGFELKEAKEAAKAAKEAAKAAKEAEKAKKAAEKAAKQAELEAQRAAADVVSALSDRLLIIRSSTDWS